MDTESSDPVAQRLADLFEQHLNLSDSANIGKEPRQRELNAQAGHQQSDVKYSITQHYTHSSHVTAPTLHPLQPHRDDHIARLLIQNDVSPSSLLRSQLDLFQRSGTDDQARLILLWRLAPPNYARNGGQELADRLGEYQSITIQQEEELAWLRYQRYYAGRTEKADVYAEELCGRPSVLGPFYGQEMRSPENSSFTNANRLPLEKRAGRADEDEEMT